MEQRVNIFASEFRKNPYPYYAAMRREGPLCQVDPGGIQVVTRYGPIIEILKDPRRFSSAGLRGAWQLDWAPHNPLVHSIVSMDPPEHTRMRGTVTRAFGSPAISALLPRIRGRASAFADRLVTLGEADFVTEFAALLPAFAIAEMLGLDTSLSRNFKRWSDDLVSISPAITRREDQARIARTIEEVSDYITKVIERRRARPTGDLVSHLVQLGTEDESLTGRALVDFLVLLLVAGYETTAYLLTNSLLFLSQRPEITERLRKDPTSIPRFIDEMLRYDPPSFGVVRTTTEEVVIDGVNLPAGRTLLLLLASANRDPQKFDHPDEFDMDRQQGGVAFGYGIHFCVGANLARAEARIGLEELLLRFRGFERLSDDIRYNSAISVRGPLELPLRFIQA